MSGSVPRGLKMKKIKPPAWELDGEGTHEETLRGRLVKLKLTELNSWRKKTKAEPRGFGSSDTLAGA